MSFISVVFSGRPFRVVFGVAALLWIKRGPEMAQSFDAPDAELRPKPPPPPLPWQERGLRAALADPSPTLHGLAVREVVGKKRCQAFCTQVLASRLFK